MIDNPYEFPRASPLWFVFERVRCDDQQYWRRFNEWWQNATGEAQSQTELRMLQLLQMRARIEAMGLLSDSIPVKIDGTPGMDFADPEFTQKYPTLAAFLFQPHDDAGKPRKLSSVIMFVEDGSWKAGLRENNHALSLWVSARSVAEIWDVLEAKLGERPIPWRAQTVYGGTTRRRP